MTIWPSRRLGAAARLLSFSLALCGATLLSGPARAQTDTTPPTVSVTSPAANSHLSSVSPTGSAADAGSGIQKVTLSLYRLAKDASSNQYWNGSAWVGSSTSVNATLSAPGMGGQVTWTWPSATALPSGTNFGIGRYFFLARAYDNANNSTAVTNIFYLGTDTTAPTVAFNTPDDNQTMDHVVEPTGTASDAGGIRLIRITLSRTDEIGPTYWNGAAWSTAQTFFTATVTPDDPNDTARTAASWQIPGATWPTGSDWANGGQLPAGIYTWRIYANDTSENATNNVTRNFRVVPVDSTAPSVAFTAPTNGSLLTAWNGTVTGTSQDPKIDPNTPGSGVVRVTLSLSRNWSGVTEYYSSTGTWSTSGSSVYADVDLPDANGVQAWTGTLPGVAAYGLPTGTYNLKATATDRYNNNTSASATISVTPQDTTAPTASVTVPASGANLSRLTALGGTAADDSTGSGLARVYVQLSELFPNGAGNVRKYWTGSAWSTTATNLPILVPSNPAGTFSWSITSGLPSGTDLPAGSAQVKTWCVDRYSNQSASVTQSFNIVANTAPVASGQTLTTAYNTALPVTLSATDTQGDVVTYAVATQPAHGTLSGSAPTLTYTPNAGFNGDDSFTFKAQDYALTGNIATVTIHVSSVPYVDALAKVTGDEAYTGDDIISADGAGETVSQTVVGDAKATYHVAIQKVSEDASMVVKVSAPAPGTGWTVKYFDALTGGTEITAEVTSATGWTVTAGASNVYLRVEVTRTEAVTAPAALSILVTARPENDSTHVDAVKLVTTANPILYPDLEIKPDDETTAYIGQTITNADGSGQTVSLGLTYPTWETVRGYRIKVREKTGIAGAISVHGPAGGSAGLEGWTVRYLDGTTDVTTVVTGTGGYSVTLEANGEHVLKLELTASRTVLADAAVLVKGDSETSNVDAVKARGLLPVLNPDLEIKADTEAAAYIGDGTINTDGTNQTVSQDVTYATWGTKRGFLVKVREKEGLAGPVAIHGPQGDGTGLGGWTIRYLDGTQDVTAAVTDSPGYTVTLDAEGERVLKVELTATKAVSGDAAVLVQAQPERGDADAVLAQSVLPQFIGGLEWSVDNKALDDPAKLWLPQPAGSDPPPAIPQGTAITVRAIPGKTPLAEWPWPIGAVTARPNWTDIVNGVTHFRGPAYTAHYKSHTGDGAYTLVNTIKAECGNEKSFAVRVLPYYEMDIWAEEDVLAAGGVGDGAQTEVTTQVTDTEGNAIRGVKVRFTLIGGSGQLIGSGPGSNEALTDDDGYATVILKSGTAGTSVQIRAEVELPPGVQTGEAPVTTEVSFQ